MAVSFKKENDIGFIIFDDPDAKVNVLKFDVMQELDKLLDEVAKEKLVALIIKSNKKDVFIAGADIKEIETIREESDGIEKAKAGQDILNKIEDLPFPTFAVIDGVALGGGCELALSCLYRIATFNSKVRIGLPEVKLGFVPGFGGTYRLPRIVGLSNGMKMILTGSPVDSTKAFRSGLVDHLVPSTGLDTHVMSFVRSVLDSGKLKQKYNRKHPKGMAGFADNSRIGNMIVFSKSKEGVLKMMKDHYPAPLAAIDVVKENFYCDRQKGLDIEAKAFGRLAITDISKYCVKLFYMSEKYRKLTVKGTENIKPAEIHNAAILGAGVMGGGIAQLFSAKGIWSRLKDISYEQLANGYKAADTVYKGAVKKRKLTKALASKGMAHITSTLDYSGFKKMDIVIEAVVEKMEVKQKVFKELSDATNPNTILASNTSALSVTEMSKDVKDPSKVIGFHFFNPVHRMPLVEVITTEHTSDETLVATLALVKRIGKTPIVCKDSPGFIVNRILLAYMSEAGRIIEESHRMEDIDKIMVDFGMPMGPFTLSDEVGLDVGLKVMQILESAFGNRFTPVDLFKEVLEKGLLGKKSKKGFYIHGKKRTANGLIQSMLKSSTRPLDKEEALNRMVLIMVNEAARCLEEGIVDEADAIDIGMIFGTGFPPFRGGLLHYADKLGIDKIIKTLNGLNDALKTDRFTPAGYLLDLQKNNKSFYS